MARLVGQEGCRSTKLSVGWTCATSVAAEAGTPPPRFAVADRVPAPVPGTVAAALQRGRPEWRPGDLHASDHWYRLDLHLPPGAWIEFAGLATLAEVWIDGQPIARSDTMFRSLIVPVPPGGGERLEIGFRALRPALRRRSPGPRARWRGNLADEEALRHHRTTLLGHMPGWSGNTPVIGPVRPIVLHEPVADAPVVRSADLCTRLTSGGAGLVTLRLHGPNLRGFEGSVTVAGHRAVLREVGGELHGDLRLPEPPLWWPHTHGEPTTLSLAAEINGAALHFAPIGFRTVERQDPTSGFGLSLNGTAVFCRGAVWAGLDPSTTPSDPVALERTLDHARRAGLNMLRIPGFTAYETPEFLDCCDRLGFLVWHDFMFARFDYAQDDVFLERARDEARAFLHQAAAHPCLAVLCGGTEVAQTAAMSGCAPPAWHSPLLRRELARVAAAECPAVPYVPESPYSEDEVALPFAASATVSHYFGVGAYGRPMAELARAGVRFASECLAFANVPEPATCRAAGDRHAAPRDRDAGWDFADVRDHYTGMLFGEAPAVLRRQDRTAADELGRAAVATIMQEALSAWRTDGVCAGALVLMLHDVVPGPGWGVIANDGRPKSALYALGHVCQPIQVLLRDEGHDGVVLVLLNETGALRRVRLRLRGLRPDGTAEALGETVLDLDARTMHRVPAIALTGRWRDLANAWQFGPPGFTVLGATLDDAETGGRLSDAAYFPGGPALPCGQPDLATQLDGEMEGWSLTVSSRGFAQFVRIDDDACVPDDGYFHLWPGEARAVPLRPLCREGKPSGTVSALNARTPAHYGVAA